LLWSPDVYGEPGDAESVAKRGFELITEDLEWEEPSPVRRTKPVKKAKGQLGGKSKSGDHDQVGGEDEDDPLGVTAELAKESWEVQFFYTNTLLKSFLPKLLNVHNRCKQFLFLHCVYLFSHISFVSLLQTINVDRTVAGAQQPKNQTRKSLPIVFKQIKNQKTKNNSVPKLPMSACSPF
jgi:hypothetical protein